MRWPMVDGYGVVDVWWIFLSVKFNAIEPFDWGTTSIQRVWADGSFAVGRLLFWCDDCCCITRYEFAWAKIAKFALGQKNWTSVQRRRWILWSFMINIFLLAIFQRVLLYYWTLTYCIDNLQFGIRHFRSIRSVDCLNHFDAALVVKENDDDDE